MCSPRVPATREGQAASRSWSGLRGGVEVRGGGAGAASGAALRSGAGPALNLGSGAAWGEHAAAEGRWR